jgi:hypothetical protein
MKHIRIYEEYSEDDLNDLIGDLESIGHKHRLVMGEDFGFGKDMQGQNTGEEVLYLSDLAKEKIKEALKRDIGYSFFTNSGISGKPFDGWRGIKGISSPGKYGMNQSISGLIVDAKDSIWYSGNPSNYPPFVIKLQSGSRAFPNKKSGNLLLGKERVKELYSKIIPYIEEIKF